MSLVTIAACEYPIERPQSFQAWNDKLQSYVQQACEADAQLLIFPEYAALELAALFPPAVYSDLHAQIAAIQDLLGEYRETHARLAREYSVTLVAGSFPVNEDGRYHNRAYVYGPQGEAGWQDKLIMTRFEAESWDITPGKDIKLFSADWGNFGLITCYDSEFPIAAHQLVKAGADILLAPSCTDSEAGYQRVRLGCRARAMENQCYVVQSPTVGEAAWSPALDVNIGRAGVYAPLDIGFPDDGVLIDGATHGPWLIHSLKLKRIQGIRRHGRVKNLQDWDKQPAADSAVQRIAL